MLIYSIVPDYDPVQKNGNAPEKDSSRDPDEWLTITETALRLGVDQKQVRRWRDKLDEKDRTCPGHAPQRLRLSAVLELRQQGQKGRQSLLPAPSEGEDSPSTVSAAAFGLMMGLLATLEEKEARIRELNETLAHERDVTRTLVKTLPPAEEQTSTTQKETSNRRTWWAWWRRKEP